MNGVESSFVKAGAQPKVIKETPATAWVDGESALGVVVGTLKYSGIWLCIYTYQWYKIEVCTQKLNSIFNFDGS